MDKSKYVKRNLVAEIKTLARFFDPHVTHREKESFYEYLRSATNIVTKNVYTDVDNTYKSLSNLINNKNIVVSAADKETCTVILNRTDMINDGIAERKYIKTADNTPKDLKRFQGFRPKSNQPGRFFATAKTHKFDSVNDITLDKLKLRPIMDQTGTYIYNTSKVVAKYLRPLSKNKYSFDDTLIFPDLLKNAEESEDYEDVSYDVESLFTSITVKETIDYIIQKIYVKKEIKPFCKKSIFIKLLKKLTQECAFRINNILIKQVDGCPMGGPISVVFSDIYVCKMEEDLVITANPIFYKRYVDDTYVGRKKHETDKLFIDLNSYHENIKLTLEINPEKFLDIETIRTNQRIKTQVYNKKKKASSALVFESSL